MPRTTLASLLGTLAVFGAISQAGAQTSVRLSAGATLATPLVRDDLGGEITVKSAVAPTVAVALAHPVGHGYRMVLEGSLGSSTLKVTDNGVDDDIGTLRTLGITLLLDGSLGKSLRWQAGAGALMYRPSEAQGIFLDDSPTRWLLAVGASWSRPVTASMSFVANARYDYSNFTTKHLDRLGYSQFTTVHRVGLFAGVERRF